MGGLGDWQVGTGRSSGEDDRMDDALGRSASALRSDDGTWGASIKPPACNQHEIAPYNSPSDSFR